MQAAAFGLGTGDRDLGRPTRLWAEIWIRREQDSCSISLLAAPTAALGDLDQQFEALYIAATVSSCFGKPLL